MIIRTPFNVPSVAMSGKGDRPRHESWAHCHAVTALTFGDDWR